MDAGHSVNGQPRAAREAYLDALPAEERATVLRRAERAGPRPDDPDWLVGYAAQRLETTVAVAAARIEAAVRAGASDEELAALKRIESRIDQLPTARTLEPLLVRADEPAGAAATVRDLTVFAITLLFCICVALIGDWPALRSPVALVAAFGFGACCAFGYLWIEPIVSPLIERHRRKRL